MLGLRLALVNDGFKIFAVIVSDNGLDVSQSFSAFVEEPIFCQTLSLGVS